jgi:ATP-dependent Clp protease ATP-binding subunit ClpX
VLIILDGTVALVAALGGRKDPKQEYLHIVTSKFLFIVGGAFDGLEEIITKRLGENSIGFSASLDGTSKINQNEIFQNVETKDLIKFGLIPEFIGRLPIVTNVNELEKESLIKILTEPKNAITKQFKKMFALDEIDLIFTDDSLDALADLALERNTGARGLRSILEKILLNEMYESPSRKDIDQIILDKENVLDGIQPKLVLNSNKDSKNSKPA